MKTDVYTKIVLTVIAVALVVLVFQNTNLNLVQSVYAENRASVSLPSNTMDVNIVSVNGEPVQDGVLGVSVTNAPNVRVIGNPNVHVTNMR